MSLLISARYVLRLGYTPSQINALLIATITTNTLSIIGCFFNLITTLLLKKTGYSLNKMVIGLSLMDILYNFTPLIGSWVQENLFLCQTYAFFTYIGYAGSLVWTCCFGHCLYSSVKRGEGQAVVHYIKPYIWISTLSGILFGIFVVVIQYYQVYPGNGGCLHYSNGKEFDWRDFIVSDLTAAIVVLYSGFCYLSVINKLRQFGIRMHLELMCYPLILVICLFPWVCLSVYNMIAVPARIPFSWVLVANVLMSAQGLLNAFAYGLSYKIVIGYRNKCCNRRQKSVEGSRHHTSLLLSEEKLTSELESDGSSKIAISRASSKKQINGMQ